MPINGSDNRFVVSGEALNSLGFVAAVDTQVEDNANVGSGVLISPNHVLTASHVIFPLRNILNTKQNVAQSPKGIRVTGSNRKKLVCYKVIALSENSIFSEKVESI